MNSTLLKILREAGIAVGLTTAVGLFAYSFFGTPYSEAIKNAHAANERAAWHIQASEAAWSVAEMMADRAATAEARADSAAKRAAVARAIAEEKTAELAALPPAPDTCAAWIEPLTVARDSALAAADHWQSAYQEQMEATAALHAGLDTVKVTDKNLQDATRDAVDASENLAKTVKRSFGSRLLRALKPKINIDAVTFDPRTGDVETGPKVGLGWSISL